MNKNSMIRTYKTSLATAGVLSALALMPIARAQDMPELPAAPAPAAADTMRQATEAYNAGVAALNNNALTEAEGHFLKATELSPNDAGAWMFLGYVRLRQEKYPDALTALEKAQAQSARLDAKLQPILYNNLGIAYANTDEPAKALNAYQKAIDLSKDEYTDARFNLAFALLGAKRYKDAETHLLLLRDQRTTDRTFQSSIYDGLAEAFENQNNWAQALGAYSKVVDLNKTDPTARFNLALALSKTGRVDDAIPQAQEVLKLRPNHQPTLLLLGDLYSRKKKWKEAKDILGRYVLAKPDDFSAWFSLGVANDYTSDFDSAIDAYSRAEGLAPNDPAVKNNLGRIYFKRKKYPEAVEKLKQAIALDSNFEDARVNLALVYTAQDNWDGAIEQWKSYIEISRKTLQDPGTSDADKTEIRKRVISARGALAENYLKAELYPDAGRQYKMILSETPDNLDVKTNLGLAYYHMKKLPEATTIYREVIKVDPTNAIAYNNLGVVLEARNLRTEALQNYRKALEIKPDYTEAKTNVERLTKAT